MPSFHTVKYYFYAENVSVVHSSCVERKIEYLRIVALLECGYVCSYN